VGNAASHRAIWAKVSKQEKCHLILEDDCYTHPRIADFITENLAYLTGSDICLFGANTDSIMLSVAPTGLTTLSMFGPKYPSHEWIKAALANTRTERVELHKLLKALGTCAYLISPNGARKLSSKLFPLSLETTNIPLITDRMPAISIDRAGCRIYPDIKAYICHPFLAYTPNVESEITT
jgi:GR25 family glycosyltransferase involved in LPS biosynthesis